MSRFALSLITVLVVLTTSAQDTLSTFTYFNKTYGGENENWSTRVGIETNRGYMAIGFLGTTGPDQLNLRLLDKTGEVEEVYPFTPEANFDNCDSGANTRKLNDSTFIYINCFRKNAWDSSDLDIYFVKANSNGDIMQTSVIADSPHREIPWALVEMDNGDFLVLGSQQVAPGEDTQFYLARITEDGFKVWENTQIAGEPGGNSIAFSAVRLDNGNYLVGGGAFFASKAYETTLLEISPSGEFVSLKHLGGTGHDCGAKLLLTPSGDIFLSSCYREAGDLDPSEYYALLDQDLEILWDTINTDLEVGTFRHSVLNTNRNSFIGVVGYESDEGFHQNAILEIGHGGEVLMLKPISPDPNKNVYVYDMRPTSDGGYLITGREHFPQPQRGWVLKVDSLGNTCSEIGCDSTVYVIDVEASAEESFSEISIRIVPNPVSEWVRIQSDFRIKELKVYQSNGALVKRTNQSEFSVSDFSSGIYFVEALLENGVIVRDKLIVE